MNNTRERGQYRIQAVAEMTGIPSATLRAWERRYGIPAPARTRSAYRLYSDEDVALVTRLRDLCAKGMAPAEAARLLRETLQPALDTDIDAWQSASRKIEDAVERFDPYGIEEAMRQALILGSASAIFEKVIAPTMRRIGDRWHDGTLSVAQEHLATDLLSCTTRDLLRLVQAEDAERTVLLACFEHETHVLPLHGIAFRFAAWGFRTIILGARTPPDALRVAVRHLQPDIVGLSTTISVPAVEALPLLEGYRQACGDIPWFVGGQGVADVAKLVETAGGMPAPMDMAQLRNRLEAAMATRRSPSRRAEA